MVVEGTAVKADAERVWNVPMAAHTFLLQV
jgi:hypothetical protein